MTSTSNASRTSITADPALPTITIVREFDASPERVFRAWVDPELFVRWIGPRSIDTRIDQWDARTGGSWRYTSVRGDDSWSFFGSFHEVRPSERLVQTFSMADFPDGVSLETMTFDDLGGSRTRIRALSVVESLQIRDQIVASGMDTGVVEGYEKLDELLATTG